MKIDKKYKVICMQCKECEMPYLPNGKIPCSDDNCKCHKKISKTGVYFGNKELVI